MKIIIKHHKNRNDYLLSREGLWVRDFSKTVSPIDINNLTVSTDYHLLVENELRNRATGMANIAAESFFWRDVVIVSDGYKFEERHHLLDSLPKKVKIIAVNKALAKWKAKRLIDFYVVNNPYKDCVTYLPRHDYHPPCIASSRTSPDFVRRYKARRSTLYRYDPVKEERFSSFKTQDWVVDDYRNPICAAMALANRFGVERLLFFCCDESFGDERPGAEQLENGLWMYPQHRISQSLIEGNCYWMKSLDFPVKVGSFCEWPQSEWVEGVKEVQTLSFFD